ncbi:MAG: glycerophosphodiester phosphodiesterase family protein [Bacillota bacterium]
MWLKERPFAHRGLHNEQFPENSMGSFKNAIKENYFIELDVRLMADDEVVVFHDANLKRMCKQALQIKKLTSEDLRNKKFYLPNGEKIPLLKDVIKLCQGHTKLLVEIKMTFSKGTKLEEKVYELIKGQEDWIAVQGFAPSTIKWFSENAPEFLNGYLATHFGNPIADKIYDRVINKVVEKNKVDFLAFNIKSLPSKSIDEVIKKKEMKLLSWTVKSEDDIKKAKESGVDNIIFEGFIPKDGNYNK